MFLLRLIWLYSSLLAWYDFSDSRYNIPIQENLPLQLPVMFP